MELIYTEDAKKDISFWKKSGNIPIQNKITKLLIAIVEEPYLGIGKPELLKHGFSGCWSRRINREHRIVYKVLDENEILILSLRGHYH